MTTTIYLRHGRSRPYHIAVDGRALCGALSADDDHVHSIATAPYPLNDCQVCLACLSISRRPKAEALSGHLAM